MDGRFQEGDWVVMHDMVNSAMNGKVGLLERFDDESGRWLVDLADAGCGNVLPAKLRRVMPGNEEAAEQKANGEQVVEQEGDGNAAEQKGGLARKKLSRKGKEARQMMSRKDRTRQHLSKEEEQMPSMS